VLNDVRMNRGEGSNLMLTFTDGAGRGSDEILTFDDIRFFYQN